MELLDHRVVLFLIFLRNVYTVFHSGCTILHSHQQSRSVPLSSHSYEHLLFLLFLTRAILTSLRWCVIVVLASISLIISYMEHIFLYLLAICVSGKISIQVLCPFLNKIVLFWFVLSIELCEFFLNTFWILTVIRHIFCNYLLWFSRLPFYFAGSFLHCVEAL